MTVIAILGLGAAALLAVLAAVAYVGSRVYNRRDRRTDQQITDDLNRK